MIKKHKHIFIFNHQQNKVNSTMSNTNTTFYSPFLFLNNIIRSILNAASKNMNPLMDMITSNQNPLPELQHI